MIQRATTSPPALDSGHFRNAQEWWDALGRVPMERIVFDPLPGTATEADVVRLDDHEDRICELIDGTLVEKPMGLEESLIAARIITLISTFVAQRKLGIVSGEAGMMRILGNRIRIPDVAFISFGRLPNRQIPVEPVPSIVPDLVVEVLSDSNTAREMTAKLQEYFTAGVRLVWYVDLHTRSVDTYTSPENPKRTSGSQILTGGDVLPGFEFPVETIFQII